MWHEKVQVHVTFVTKKVLNARSPGYFLMWAVDVAFEPYGYCSEGLALDRSTIAVL